ncbi:MAG: DUF5667 domain-containing protein [bacterium]|nr:DUF5667 domain-containing protein [bacterium]
MLRRFLVCVCLGLLGFILVSQNASAGLADFTTNPGRFLPDSPFFIFDELWGRVRVLFSFNAGDKASTYADLAGERLIEVQRLLVEQKTKQGVLRALEDYQRQLDALVTVVDEAKKNSPMVMDQVKGTLDEQRKLFSRLREELPDDIEYILSPAEGALLEKLEKLRK